MFKLANQVLDQYDDVTKDGLKKLAAINPKAYLMTPSEHGKIADDDFALSVITKQAQKLNKFPVDTADNTWLSGQFFEMNHGKLTEKAASIAAHFIKKAYERFDLKETPAVAALSKEASANVYVEGESDKAPERHKTVDMSKFAEVQAIGDNYAVAQYTFATPAHVKLGSMYFEKFASEIPVAYRHKYAAALQKRAHELGMPPLKGGVQKYASDHYSGALDAHIRSRVSLVEFTKPDLVGPLNKLASMKKELTPSEFAQALHSIDKRAGLDKHYGGYVKDPFLATFGMEPNPYSGWKEKTASGTLTADDVKKVSVEKYAKIKEYFGKSVADELKKEGVAIFESLPDDAKEVIAGIANGQI